MDALQRAIEAAGGLTRLAERIGVSPQVVSNWRSRGIPADRVLAVERASDGKVSRSELRPDLYPLESAA